MFAEARDIISKVDNGLTWVPSLEQKKKHVEALL